MSDKLLVIGLDGDSFKVLDPLIEKGFLPHIAKLTHRSPRTTLEVSPVSWLSISAALIEL